MTNKWFRLAWPTYDLLTIYSNEKKIEKKLTEIDWI